MAVITGEPALRREPPERSHRGAAALIRKGDRVIGVIGPQTFSSGVLNAMTLKARYGATLVGRPTGGKPTHFGEVRTFTLPHSRLVVQYSTKHFVHGDPRAD